MESTATSNVTTVIMLVMLISAVYHDIRIHRISNVLVVMILILGLASQLGSVGSPGIVNWIGGLAVGLVIFLPFYIGGGMGAGDVKLMAAVGAFLGPVTGTVACGFALLAGLPLVMLASAQHYAKLRFGKEKHDEEFTTTGVFTNTGTFKALSKAKHKPMDTVIIREGKADRVPYAAAIAAGALAGLWWSGRIDQLVGVIMA